MGEIGFGGGACCPRPADDVTHLRIGKRGVVVGLVGLEVVFAQLYALGRHPDEATDEELVDMARQFNYIRHHPDAEADYAAALRKAYANYCNQREVRSHDEAGKALPKP